MPGLVLHYVGDIYATPGTVAAFQADPTGLDAAGNVLRRADVRCANLEAPLLVQGQARFSTGVRLHSSPAVIDLLTHLGFDVVGVANNHMMDFGPAGLDSTLRALKRGGLATMGAGSDRTKALRPALLEVKGAKLGFLQFCDDEGGGALPGQPGVALVPAQRDLLTQVRRLRDQVDYAVVAIHTGIEFSPYPEPYFVELAHRLIDAGAALVVGHHPHVPQGWQRHGRGLIAYSLGDFLFDLPRHPTDLTPRQHQFNHLHPILEVELADGGVRAHRMHWLGRTTAGRFEHPVVVPGFDVNEEWRRLCDVLADPAEYGRRLRREYRAQLRELAVHTPLHFLRQFARGGSQPLKGFLWWLATLRRRPKRRMLWGGLASLLGWRQDPFQRQVICP